MRSQAVTSVLLSFGLVAGTVLLANAQEKNALKAEAFQPCMQEKLGSAYGGAVVFESFGRVALRYRRAEGQESVHEKILVCLNPLDRACHEAAETVVCRRAGDRQAIVCATPQTSTVLTGPQRVMREIVRSCVAETYGRF
jgi:hypothetical protein